jgi:hypothetical protein
MGIKKPGWTRDAKLSFETYFLEDLFGQCPGSGFLLKLGGKTI